MRYPRLEVDFVAPPRRGRLAGLLVLAAALAVAAGEVHRYRQAVDGLRHLEAMDALLVAARPAPPASREQQEAQIKAARTVMQQLALPWPQLIESLERAAIPGVALLQIQPDAERRVLRVSAEARAHGFMLDYVRRLEATRAFAAVHLLNHQVQLDDPRQPVQFSLQASFRSDP